MDTGRPSAVVATFKQTEALCFTSFQELLGQQTGSKRLKSAWLNLAEAGDGKRGNPHE
jgi:hypothetical protein